MNIFLDHSITLNVVCRLWKSSVNTAPSFKMSGSHLLGAFWRKPLVTAINYRYLKWEITHKSQYIQHELFQLMIQRTRSAKKDVGVIVLKNLKPSKNVLKAAEAANKVLGLMARGFHYRSKETRIELCYARPHLEYNVQAWWPWTKSDILQVQYELWECVLAFRQWPIRTNWLKETIRNRVKNVKMIKYVKCWMGKLNWKKNWLSLEYSKTHETRATRW